MVSRSDASKRDSCAGKRRFRKFARAESAATRAAKALSEPMHAYKCAHCNRFHVGAHHKLERRAPPPTDEES